LIAWIVDIIEKSISYSTGQMHTAGCASLSRPTTLEKLARPLQKKINPAAPGLPP
jgi:hypothetical protein